MHYLEVFIIMPLFILAKQDWQMKLIDSRWLACPTFIACLQHDLPLPNYFCGIYRCFNNKSPPPREISWKWRFRYISSWCLLVDWNRLVALADISLLAPTATG